MSWADDRVGAGVWADDRVGAGVWAVEQSAWTCKAVSITQVRVIQQSGFGCMS